MAKPSIFLTKAEISDIRWRLPAGWSVDISRLTKVDKSTVSAQLNAKKPRKDGKVLVYCAVWDSAVKLAEEQSVRESKARERKFSAL